MSTSPPTTRIVLSSALRRLANAAAGPFISSKWIPSSSVSSLACSNASRCCLPDAVPLLRVKWNFHSWTSTALDAVDLFLGQVVFDGRPKTLSEGVAPPFDLLIAQDRQAIQHAVSDLRCCHPLHVGSACWVRHESLTSKFLNGEGFL